MTIATDTNKDDGTLALTLTPTANFDAETRQVLDVSQVAVRRFSIGDRLTIIDLLADGKLDVYQLSVAAINCYDHLLLLDGVHHRILNGFVS